MSLLSLLEEYNPWWREPGRRSASSWTIRRQRFADIWTALVDLADRRAILLLGPRQVGKTVLLRQVADALLDNGVPARNVIFFDLSDHRAPDPISLRAVVEAGRAVAAPDQPRYFLLDEIQTAEAGWDRYLKSVIDNLERLPDGRCLDRLLFAGSAASALRAADRESGLGRWDELALEGLSFHESLLIRQSRIPRRLDEIDAGIFERYLERGGFPEHQTGEDTGRALARLRDDVADKAILRDLLHSGVEVRRVQRLFVELVQRSGDELVLANLMGSLSCDRRSLEHWLELLEDTRLIVPLEQYVESSKREARLRRRVKLYAADHGLISAFSMNLRGPEDEAKRGKIFETVVYRHLRGLVTADRSAISYLASGEGAEIDFLVEGPRGRVALEVTCARDAKPDKVGKLAKAGERVGSANLWLITDGVAEERRGTVRVLPLPAFLLHPERIWEAP